MWELAPLSSGIIKFVFFCLCTTINDVNLLLKQRRPGMGLSHTAHGKEQMIKVNSESSSIQRKRAEHFRSLGSKKSKSKVWERKDRERQPGQMKSFCLLTWSAAFSKEINSVTSLVSLTVIQTRWNSVLLFDLAILDSAVCKSKKRVEMI